MNGPIRGNYDGLVVLTAITKDILPTKGVNVSGLPNINKKTQERFLDHEYYSLGLETSLTNHFMYSELDYSARCVIGNRLSAGMGDAISVMPIVDGERKIMKKFQAYSLYVAYRLTNYTAYSHGAKLSQLKMISLSDKTPRVALSPTAALSPTSRDIAKEKGKPAGSDEPESEQAKKSLGPEAAAAAFKLGQKLKIKKKSTRFTNTGSGQYDVESLDSYEFGGGGGDDDLVEGDYEGEEEYAEYATEGGIINLRAEGEDEDEKMLEELEDKQLVSRISTLESDHFKLTEQVWKLEHDRSWVENRLTALETDMNELRTDGKITSEN